MSYSACDFVDALLRECVPGGSSCDPQQVADAIREWFANMETRPCCELAALKASNAELRSALETADAELRLFLDADMTCDHSVGICACTYNRMREQMRSALARNKTQGEQQ